MKYSYRIYLFLSSLLIFVGYVVGTKWAIILGMLLGALVCFVGGIKGLIDPWIFGWEDIVKTPTELRRAKWEVNLIRFTSTLAIWIGLFIVYLVLTL